MRVRVLARSLTVAKTPAQLKRDERDRYRKLGRVAVQVWVHPDDRERIQKLAALLNRRREK